ncbi:hypothetical protein AK812_SmicGene35183 [Symbiodinium microadriaticum]|uniref:Uncharacterized protein n=1 Tax=Symbiodinium microadriaticum TaxID=2951 RepID=A0A1Q9CM49_SYMMI|nr:hypothetical protein AK812_SmicGene35183 [Symbiodinium microadriaticum]
MALKIPAAMQPSGMLTPVAMTRPNLRHSFTANDICSMDQTTKFGLPVPVVCPDKPAPTLRHLELPKPRWAYAHCSCSCMEAYETWWLETEEGGLVTRCSLIWDHHGPPSWEEWEDERWYARRAWEKWQRQQVNGRAHELQAPCRGQIRGEDGSLSAALGSARVVSSGAAFVRHSVLDASSPATTVPGTPRSPRWTYADSGDTWTSFHGDRQLKPVQTPPAHSRNSILDFEHLFSQYFVQVRPSRLRGLWHSTALPSPEEVVDAWAEDTAAYIMRYADVCNVYWPQAQLQLPTLHERLLQELQWTVEWSSEKRYRVDITVYPERVCHRLLWAIGDAILPDKFLSHTQRHLQARWRDYRFRCSDGMLLSLCYGHRYFTIHILNQRSR